MQSFKRSSGKRSPPVRSRQGGRRAPLAGLDLNLLLALDALLFEESVTRAAERLGLSQPAMSRLAAR